MGPGTLLGALKVHVAVAECHISKLLWCEQPMEYTQKVKKKKKKPTTENHSNTLGL